MSLLRTLGVGLLGALVLADCGGELPDYAEGDRGTDGVAWVRVTTAGNRGMPDAPLPFSTEGVPLAVRLEAFRRDNTPARSFNGYLRLSMSPGLVLSVEGPSALGSYVRATNGVAEGITVRVARGYGQARVWAEDNGYVPVDPLRTPRPACSNGLDDDGDGRVDYPADTGCAAANDDNEVGGSFAVGTSEPIYFDTPLISDVQGRAAQSPLLNERITLRGRILPTAPEPGDRRHRLVVTQTDNSGFFITDIDDRSCDGQACYNSIYSFNFRSPDGMRVCDLVQTLTGSVAEFVSSTQLSQPGYQVGLLWRPNDPQAGPCLVPDPVVITQALARDEVQLERLESGIVRLENVILPTLVGPGRAPNGIPMPGATNCDANNDGRIEYDGGIEDQCATACANNPSCSEWTSWARFGQVLVTLPGGGAVTRLGVNARAVDPTFDPTRRRAPSATITGTLRQVGPNWVVQPRCGAEIVYAGMPVRRPNEVCLFERPLSED